MLTKTGHYSRQNDKIGRPKVAINVNTKVDKK